MAKPRKELTLKQELFAQRFVETGNASESYRQAYEAEDWSSEAVNVEASRLCRHPNVSPRIKHLQQLALKRHEVTFDRMVSEYAKLAFLDIRKAFTPDGDLRPIVDLDDDTAAAVAGVEFEEIFDRGKEGREHVGRIHKIKLSDKRGALDSLSKLLGFVRASDSASVAVAPPLIINTNVDRPNKTAEPGVPEPEPLPSTGGGSPVR